MAAPTESKLSSEPLVVSLGGGLNSTALCVLLHEQGERPDLIMFADTGGERDYTYDYLKGPFSAWLDSVGFPEITVVKGRVKDYETLEDECLGEATLPSLAFGFKRCSDHWKKRPQQRHMKQWDVAQAAWAEGLKVVQCIGYDAEESHRSKIPEDKWFRYRYPLVESNWGRDECQEALLRVGLPRARKSSCFFCPASRLHEILELKETRPDLFDRAVAMEKAAKPNLKTVKGLGRRFSWEGVVREELRQIQLFPPEESCGCYDGEYDSEGMEV